VAVLVATASLSSQTMRKGYDDRNSPTSSQKRRTEEKVLKKKLYARGKRERKLEH